ncbi:hypothetical protein ES705_01656 [subsurface metagenome]|nr:hypothetical protein [Clostridia bacterium]
MITEKDITEANEEEKLWGKSYLKGIIDFVKWASTIAIAVILWVGNTMTSTTGFLRILAIVGLVFLVGSLIIAIIIVNRVLIAWGREWDLARESYSFYVLKKFKTVEPSKVTEQKETEQINHLLKAEKATWPFSQPTVFSVWVSCHIAFLVAGLLIYVLAQILSRF